MNAETVAASTGGFSGLVLAISIVLALVNCFFGYRMQRVWIGLICFFVGLIGGYVVCGAVVNGVSTAIAVLVGVALGALLALLSFKLYIVGVFLFAAGISFWACVLLLTGVNQWLAITAGAAVGLLVGFLAAKFTRTAMILSSGISGGLAAFKSILLLIPVAAVHELTWLPFVGGGILAILGIYVQYHSDAKQRSRHNERETAKAAREAARQETAKLDSMLPDIAGEESPRAVVMPEPLPVESEPESEFENKSEPESEHHPEPEHKPGSGWAN